MQSKSHSPAVCFGLVLVAVGALFLLANFTDFGSNIGRWWPVILIAAGLVELLSNRRRRLRGASTLIIGALFLGDTLDVWSVPWRLLWPIPLLVIGVAVILGATRGKARRRRSAEAAAGSAAVERGAPVEAAGPGALDLKATFGERAQAVSDPNFPGGRINAVFGQASVDLTQAGLANGEAAIDVSATFASVVIRVPADWTVDLRVNATLAEASDKRPQPAPDSPTGTLVVTGSATFGSVEIRP